MLTSDCRNRNSDVPYSECIFYLQNSSCCEIYNNLSTFTLLEIKLRQPNCSDVSTITVNNHVLSEGHGQLIFSTTNMTSTRDNIVFIDFYSC